MQSEERMGGCKKAGRLAERARKRDRKAGRTAGREVDSYR